MARGRSGGRGASPQGRGRGPGAGTSVGRGRGGRGGQGQSPRGAARGGRRSFGAQGFRRAAKVKTGMTIVDFNKRIEEAKRVIESLPKFTPGKQRGKAVRVQYTVPISFKLQ